MSKLLELAERCEASEGGDRELDRLIRDTLFCVCINGAAEYSASIDAALALAGSDAYSIGGGLSDLHPFSVLTSAMSDCPLDGFAGRLPRFICAASLRARAAQ